MCELMEDQECSTSCMSYQRSWHIMASAILGSEIRNYNTFFEHEILNNCIVKQYIYYVSAII